VVKHFKFNLIPTRLKSVINRTMNSRKNALKSHSQNLTMNEIAEKHFKQKRVRIL
jgi:hypothetical protein